MGFAYHASSANGLDDNTNPIVDVLVPCSNEYAVPNFTNRSPRSKASFSTGSRGNWPCFDTSGQMTGLKFTANKHVGQLPFSYGVDKTMETHDASLQVCSLAYMINNSRGKQTPLTFTRVIHNSHHSRGETTNIPTLDSVSRFEAESYHQIVQQSCRVMNPPIFVERRTFGERVAWEGRHDDMVGKVGRGIFCFENRQHVEIFEYASCTTRRSEHFHLILGKSVFSIAG